MANRTEGQHTIYQKINWFDYLNIIALSLFCLITLYPFWYVLVLSLNEGRDAMLGGIYFWPRHFTLDNYKIMLSNPSLGHAYFVTIARTVSGALIRLFVISTGAYALSKRYLPGRNAILFFFMVPMFIGGTVVSRYIVMAKLGMLNNFLVYIIPQAANFFFMIIMRTFIDRLPDGLQQSAKIDGANNWQIYTRIIVPLSVPIEVTILLFAAVGYWLDFHTNLVFVTEPKLFTTQYLMYLVVRANQMASVISESEMGDSNLLQQGGTITPQSLKMAMLVIVTVPILFVYPFAQKYFIHGLTIGSIKG